MFALTLSFKNFDECTSRLCYINASWPRVLGVVSDVCIPFHWILDMHVYYYMYVEDP